MAFSNFGIDVNKDLRIFVVVIFFCKNMSTVTVFTKIVAPIIKLFCFCEYFRKKTVINLFAEILQKFFLANESFGENMQNFNVLQILFQKCPFFYMLLVTIFVFLFKTEGEVNIFLFSRNFCFRENAKMDCR
jgi:hypothetical protein